MAVRAGADSPDRRYAPILSDHPQAISPTDLSGSKITSEPSVASIRGWDSRCHGMGGQTGGQTLVGLSWMKLELGYEK